MQAKRIFSFTLQSFLRRQHDDDMAAVAYMVVTSPKNQRAEAMNRIIRVKVLDLFRDDFAELEAGGY
jgi:hypothetical protein